jgi:metal-sulfur cluster biosynthetic enzyme
MTDRTPDLAALLGVEADPDQVMDALASVVDPELGIDIVSLGLVYGVALDRGIARIRMTTTSPACPIGAYLADQVRWAVLSIDGVLDAEIEMVGEPRWSPDMMSADARARLGWLR